MLEWIARVESGEAPCPDIVLLDLNLPRYDGITILQKLRESIVFGNLPIIIVTSSDALSDRTATARLGATSYFRKPLDYDEFLMLGALVKQIISARAKAD